MAREFSMIVAEIVEWSEGLKSIFLEYSSGRMDFKAGQYVLLKAVIGGKTASRAYSIASIPSDERVEIIFRVAGEFTNYLNEVKVGDSITMVGPFGHFTIERIRHRNVVFIATGTGISPPLSMIRQIHSDGKCRNFERIIVIYGTRYRKMIVHYDEMKGHEKECGNFLVKAVLSREEDWDGLKGHVQDALPKFIMHDCDYVVCGLPAMTDDVEKILVERGIKKENIILERY